MVEALPLNMLASMNADVPTVGAQPVSIVDVHTAFCPWLPCACARARNSEKQTTKTITVPTKVRQSANAILVSTRSSKFEYPRSFVYAKLCGSYGTSSKTVPHPNGQPTPSPPSCVVP